MEIYTVCKMSNQTALILAEPPAGRVGTCFFGGLGFGLLLSFFSAYIPDILMLEEIEGAFWEKFLRGSKKALLSLKQIQQQSKMMNIHFVFNGWFIKVSSF